MQNRSIGPGDASSSGPSVPQSIQDDVGPAAPAKPSPGGMLGLAQRPAPHGHGRTHHHHAPAGVRDARRRLEERALAVWPRLDRRSLSRCRGDVARIANYVARRTRLAPETIRAILDPGLSEIERESWFG